MAGLANCPRKLQHFFEVGQPTGHRSARVAHMNLGDRCGKADGTYLHGLANQSPHLGDLRCCGRPRRGLIAHDPQAHRRVANHHGHVDTQRRALQQVHVLREGLERPWTAQPFLQRRQAHALDTLQRAQNQITVLGSGRCHAKPAVAQHRCGHPVPGRDRQLGVPQHLGVVMGVDVHKARCNHQALRIQRLPRCS